MKRIVIIGGGIGGLATAYSLKELAGPGRARPEGLKGLELVLVEKSGVLGGNIQTEKTEGFLIEGGPDCFLSEKPWAMALCKRLGLEESLLPTNEGQKTFVLSKGRLHELPEGVILMVPTKILPLVTSSLITLRGKLRMALEFFIPKRKEKGDESLASFVRRRLGTEALEKIAEPLVAGVHAGDPETMSVRSSFPRFVQLEEDYGSLIRGMLARMAQMRRERKKRESIKAPRGGRMKEKGPGPGSSPRVTMFMSLKGGLTEMIDALTSRIKEGEGAAILTGRNVTGVVGKDGGYEVLIEGEPSVNADCVVVATPSYAASELLKGLDKELSEKLLSIPYVSTATVSIAYRKADIRHPLDGFGFVVPKTENRRIMAATWTSVKWSYRAPEDMVLIRCFVGGAKQAGLVFLSDEEMARMVREELKEIMGIDAEPVLTRIYRWKDAMPQYTIGHEGRIADIEEITSRHPGLYLTGSAYHGIGISDTVREAEETAKKVIGYLKG
jgi:oxygen-dependent protoporphyrinogen oxidase